MCVCVCVCVCVGVCGCVHIRRTNLCIYINIYIYIYMYIYIYIHIYIYIYIYITFGFSVRISTGWFYGCAHIRTLDGFGYTFNGLGEYTFIETTHGNFTLQGRLVKARDANGTETNATVFSAFAARDSASDTVHVGMNANRDGR